MSAFSNKAEIARARELVAQAAGGNFEVRLTNIQATGELGASVRGQ